MTPGRTPFPTGPRDAEAGERPIAASTEEILRFVSAWTHRFRSAIKATERSSPYIQGELAYLEALDEEIADAELDSATVGDILEGAAARNGIVFDGPQPTEDPLPHHEAGVLAMWALSLGFVEGLVMGSNATVAALAEAAGEMGKAE